LRQDLALLPGVSMTVEDAPAHLEARRSARWHRAKGATTNNIPWACDGRLGHQLPLFQRAPSTGRTQFSESILGRSSLSAILATVTEELRVKTGIPGLDPLIQGGLQPGDFVLLLGDLGTGKTVFSSEFIYNSAKQYNENAVFATFEEDTSSLKRNLLRFGMDFDALEKEGKVKLLDLEALEGRGMGSNIEAILKALDDIGARRLVVDSLTAFMSGAEAKFDYSFLMHLIYKTLKREGVTTLMTVSRPQGIGVSLDIGIEEFVADGIFELKNYVSRDIEVKTQFLIRKLRGTELSRRFHSVLFTPRGIEILPYTP
jgi:circadian clock protein KaiC